MFVNLVFEGSVRAAVAHGVRFAILGEAANSNGMELDALVRAGHDLVEMGRQAISFGSASVKQSDACYAPLLASPGKIIYLGLNYYDHAKEGGRDKPEYPWFFLRAASSLVGHEQPTVLPRVSNKFDFEAGCVRSPTAASEHSSSQNLD
jgi:acylpyruvate hydrolase